MLAGVAIKPGTDVEVLWELLDSGVKEEVPDVCCFPYPIPQRGSHKNKPSC